MFHTSDTINRLLNRHLHHTSDFSERVLTKLHCLGGPPLSEERIQTCIAKAIKHGAQIRRLYNAVQS